VATNVLGSRNMAEAALAFGARAMVQVSTDKAVNPTNERGSVRLLWREKRWGVWSTSEGRGRSVFGGPEPRLPTWPVGCCALASGDVP
jgi:hypothetical protein